MYNEVKREYLEIQSCFDKVVRWMLLLYLGVVTAQRILVFDKGPFINDDTQLEGVGGGRQFCDGMYEDASKTPILA